MREGGERVVNGDDNSEDEVALLWRWGLHEDNLFVNRLPVIMLAESVLIAATIALLQVGYLTLSRLILAAVTECCGSMATYWAGTPSGRPRAEVSIMVHVVPWSSDS